MLEITAKDIADLSDTDLRTLVCRLCEADLEAGDLQEKYVTCGGHQDAPDGGLDVLVQAPQALYAEGMLTRPDCGFQVKKSNMTQAKVTKEMRPKGKLRSAIIDLAAKNGAYIIASSTTSTEPEMDKRKRAMRDALNDCPNGEALLTDYLDAGRLATWVRMRISVVLWLRERIGRPMVGWSNIPAPQDSFITDGIARVRLPGSKGELTPVLKAVEFLRNALRAPAKGCVRLVGLSGTGKTRLVQALFEKEVGSDPLPASQAFYCDYGVSPNPGPFAMASELVAAGKRAVLIVENCGFELHNRLAELCGSPHCPLSLLTVEYDIQDKPAAGTLVCQLHAASPEATTELLKARHPELSHVNRQTITHLAEGNARVALALARAALNNPGELQTELTETELFDRLFTQNQTDSDSLRSFAKVLALVYSFSVESGEAGAPSEFAQLADLAGVNEREATRLLAELNRRSLVQSRGCWRAILPHAIANRLASQALEEFSQQDLTAFLEGASRLQLSFLHRLTYLTMSDEAQRLAKEYLGPDGDLHMIEDLDADGLRALRYVAPVAPLHALQTLEAAQVRALTSNTDFYASEVIQILLALMYGAELFDRAYALMVRLVSTSKRPIYVHSKHNYHPEVFQLYLSGTHASVEQRLKAIRELIAGPNEQEREAGFGALSHMLQTRYFSSTQVFDFGGQFRDYGFQPRTWGEHSHWFRSVLAFCDELDMQGGYQRVKVRETLAQQLSGLWKRGNIKADLEKTVLAFSAREFWPAAGPALSRVLHSSTNVIPARDKKRIGNLVRRLAARTLMQRVHALVLRNEQGFWLAAGGNYDAYLQHVTAESEALGRELARDDATLDELMPEIVCAKHHLILWHCAKGLVEASTDRSMLWAKAKRAYCDAPDNRRQTTFLEGLVPALKKVDDVLAEGILDELATSAGLRHVYPTLQARAGLALQGLSRLKKNLQAKQTQAADYRTLSFANPPLIEEELTTVLPLIAALDEGFLPALDLLAMHIHTLNGVEGSECIKVAGAALLCSYDLSKLGPHASYEFDTVAEACLPGDVGRAAVVQIMHRIIEFEPKWNLPTEIPHILGLLVKADTHGCLDTLDQAGLLGSESGHWLFGRHDDLFGSPFDAASDSDILSWCEAKPEPRYLKMAECLYPFIDNRPNGPRTWKPLALSLIEKCPQPIEVVKQFFSHLYVGGWEVSHAHTCLKNLFIYTQLVGRFTTEVSAFVQTEVTRLTRHYETERMAELEKERLATERFE